MTTLMISLQIKRKLPNDPKRFKKGQTKKSIRFQAKIRKSTDTKKSEKPQVLLNKQD